MKILSVGRWALACSSFLCVTKAELNLMPQPAHVVPGQGKLEIDQSFRIAFTGYREPRLERATIIGP